MRIISLVILVCTLSFLSSCDQSTETTPTVTQGISGIVKGSESGVAVSNARLYLTNTDNTEVLVDSTLSSSSGTYKFDNVKVGQYKVYCIHDAYHYEESDAIVTANTNTIVNFNLDSVYKKGVAISFHVRNAATKVPIQGATVTLNGPWTGLTDANGNVDYDGNYYGYITFDITAAGYESIHRQFNIDTGDPIYYDTVDMVNPKDFLVASYNFSNNFIDSTGKGHNGTNHGVAWTADRFGNPSSAIYCDGATDYVSVEDADDLDFGKQDFTICVWVQTPEAQNTSNVCYVLDKSTTISNVFTGYQIAYESGYSTRAYIGTTYGTVLARANGMSDAGRWHLYTLVVRRSGYVHIYYDGENVYNEDDLYKNLPGNINTTAKLLIGGNGTTKNAFKGKIDDIKLFNIALDGETIKAIYHENGW